MKLDFTGCGQSLLEHINQSFMLALKLKIGVINQEFLLYSFLHDFTAPNPEQATVQLVFTENLRQGVTRKGLAEYLEMTLVISEGGSVPDYFDGKMYTETALEILQESISGGSVAGLARSALARFDRLDPMIREALTEMLDADKCAAALERLADTGANAGSDVFDENGLLVMDAFTPAMSAMIEYSMKYAAETGHADVKTLHLLYAMLRDKDAYPARVCSRHRPD
jgi:hypothetical protein